MNDFGGDWTKIKIEILVEYAKAYLQIMNKHKYYKLLYFDGFAGSGLIIKNRKTKIDVTVGAAKRIIELEDTRPFDVYYFVELDKTNFKLLDENTKLAFPNKEIYTICGDCNTKLLDLASYLKEPKNKNIRTLAYIDPCGMQVEWNSLKALKGLNLDMWILVPTGLGVNRLLKKKGQISDAWYEKLEKFLGLNKEEIDSRFYKKSPSLFEHIELIQKESDAIQKSALLYQTRLKELFNFVSKPYELKNSSNSIMYHLFLTSNNNAAEKIGNDIVKKYNKN